MGLFETYKDTPIKFLLGLLLFCFCVGVQAQNTKGDKPAPPPTPPAKEKKGLFGGKKNKRIKSSSRRARNVFPQSGPFVHNPSKKPKKEKPSTLRYPGYSARESPTGRDRSWTKGDASGKRIRTDYRTPRSRNIYSQQRSASGNRIRANYRTPRSRNIYPQRGPYVHNPSPKPKKIKPTSVRLPSSVKTVRRPSGRDKAWTKGDISGHKIPATEYKPKPRKVYPQSGHYVSRGPRVQPRPPNEPINKSRRLSISKAVAQGRSAGLRGAGFKSVTSQFLTRGKKNVYWGKFRKKEKAITTDIAGRKLRARNFHSPRPGLVGRDTLRFFKRSPTSRRAPSAPGGGYKSATRTGRPWSGDISGGKIRRNKARPNNEVAGEFVWPRKMSVTGKIKRGEGRAGGPISSTPKRRKAYTSPLPGKAPGAGAGAYSAFSRLAKPQKRISKAGTSKSGRSWNNNNEPILGKAPGLGAKGYWLFAKQAKPGKRITGAGGSVSRKGWNNKNQPIQGKAPGAGARGYWQFAKQTKPGKRIKGAGGSVSRNAWNNKNEPIQGKAPGAGARGYWLFAKEAKPLKRPSGLGGSTGRDHWNNKNKPIQGKALSLSSYFAAHFAGTTKTRRPPKGGGSVSGKLWNNNNQPIDVNKAGRGTIDAAQFRGRIRGVYGKAFDSQGLNFAGAKKTRRPPKGGGSVSGKMWNNNNQPLAVSKPGKGTVSALQYEGKIRYKKPAETAGDAATFRGKIKGMVIGPELSRLGLDYDGDYKRSDKGKIDNKHLSVFAKLFKKPATLPATHIKRDEKEANYTMRGKRYLFGRYVQNPNAHKESLKKDREPSGLRLNIPIVNQMRRSVNAGHYSHVMKQTWDYVRNPNSNQSALKVHEPSKANARIGDLQVNVKMRKHYTGELHPDAKFAHGYRNNVKEERTLFMNIRLTWAKLFKKNETQPRELKQKTTRPRYDPNEKGLWYD